MLKMFMSSCTSQGLKETEGVNQDVNEYKLVKESVRQQQHGGEGRGSNAWSAQTAGGGRTGERAGSPRPLASDEDEDPSDGYEAVLEGGHGQDGELGSVLQWKDGEQPPAPGGAIGYGLEGEHRESEEPLNTSILNRNISAVYEQEYSEDF